MFAMKDEQSGKVKFRGTEAECLEFSKQNPNYKYVMEDLDKDKEKFKKYQVVDSIED